MARMDIFKQYFDKLDKINEVLQVDTLSPQLLQELKFEKRGTEAVCDLIKTRSYQPIKRRDQNTPQRIFIYELWHWFTDNCFDYPITKDVLADFLPLIDKDDSPPAIENIKAQVERWKLESSFSGKAERLFKPDAHDFFDNLDLLNEKITDLKMIDLENGKINCHIRNLKAILLENYSSLTEG